MTRKQGPVILVLALLLSVLGGCGEGGMSTPESATLPVVSDGSTPDQGAGTGSPVNSPSQNDGAGNGTPGTGSVTLTWDAPTKNTDGTPLTNLAGYKIYYGTAPGRYTNTLTVGLATTSSLNLGPGTYYMAVTALNSEGAESDPSNEASKTVY